ncbi:MAG: tetratricopeptide repeat protein [candidate division WOR-3 bacterium]|nr:MAG: tetratricopeptide repeat protein [candidate division WOR-3 bacterium]
MKTLITLKYCALAVFLGVIIIGCVPTQTTKGTETEVGADTLKATQYYSIGYEYLKQGNYDEAITNFMEAIKFNRRYYGAYIALAQSYRAKRDIVAAESTYSQAKKIDPQDPRAYEGIATLYFLDYKDYDRAIAEFQRGLQVDPSNVNILNGLAASYIKKKDYDKAIQYYNKSLQYEPENVEAMFGVANVYMEKGEPDKAISYLQELVVKKPKNIDVRKRLAETLIDLKRYDEAAEQYRFLIEQEPDNYNYHRLLGSVYLQQKKYNGAETAFTEAHRLAPNNPLPLFDLSDLMIRRGKYPAAEQYVNDALALDPGNFYGQVLLGDIYERRGYGTKANWDKNKSGANVSTAKNAINLLKRAIGYYSKAKADPQYGSYAGTEIVRCNNWIGQLQEDVWFYEGGKK